MKLHDKVMLKNQNPDTSIYPDIIGEVGEVTEIRGPLVMVKFSNDERFVNKILLEKIQ